MNIDSYDILVIILSVTLAIFLVLAIILTTYLVKAAKDVREITKKAGSVVSNFETASKVATKTGPASFIGSIFTTVVENLKKNDKETNEDE